jgi:fibronectin-binding autotransporter adhesin
MKTKYNPILRSIIVNSLRLHGNLALTLSCGFAALVSGQSAFAAPRFWSGTSGVNWSTGGVGGNWTDLAAPVAGDTLTFVGTTANSSTNNDLPLDTSFGQIAFTNTGSTGSPLVGTSSFTLAGNRITMGGNITSTGLTAGSTPITDSISLDLILGATRTISAGLAHHINISGIISENAPGYSVTKSGSGILTLTNTNTFTGPFQLYQGTLSVSSIADGNSNIGAGTEIKFGNLAPTGLMLYSGAAVDCTRAFTLNGASGGATIDQSGSGLLKFSGVQSTPGVGSKTVTLQGSTAGTGEISGAIADNGTTGSTVTTTASTASGSSNLVLGSVDGLATGQNISGTGIAPGTTISGITVGTKTVALSSPTTANIPGGTSITNTALVNLTSLTKTGTGTWTLSGANTYTGSTTVQNGTLTLSGNRTATATTIFVNGGGIGSTPILNIQNGSFSSGTIAVNSGGSVSVVNHSAGAITASGNGIAFGQSAVGSTGTYNLSGGSLTAAMVMGFTTATSNGAHINTFNLSGSGSLTCNNLRIGRYDTAGAFNTDNTFAQTGGTAAVNSLGLAGNTTDAASTNPIIAELNLTGGTFSANTFASLSAGGANTSTITIGGTAQVTLPAFPTVRGTDSTATLTFDGGTLIPAAASASYMSGLTNAFITANGAKIDVPTAKDITIAQALENAPSAVGSLTKSGVGTLILTGANTYTGDTTVVDGILEISSTYLDDTSTLTIGTVAASPAVLNLPNAGTDTVASLVIDGVVQANNLYDSSNSGGAITGLGKIQVGPASNTYANWLIANSPATGFTTDTDKDGVPNGVENVLGTNPNTSSAGLTQISATTTSVTYQHTLNPTIASDVSYSYQWSSDLIEWKASGVANTAGTMGTIAPSTPVAGVVTVVTTQTGTPSSKLFTRIKAGNP